MQPHTTESAPHERLAGAVERVTFYIEQSGFCLLRVKVRGQRDLMTVIGSAASVSAGESIEPQGAWVNDREHGLQFRADQLRVVPPTTLEGIEKYLGSGMVNGIDPHFARKLVRAFGEAVFDVIETTPERLEELEGIGLKSRKRLFAAEVEQKVFSDRFLMAFVDSTAVHRSLEPELLSLPGLDRSSLRDTPQSHGVLESSVEGSGGRCKWKSVAAW